MNAQTRSDSNGQDGRPRNWLMQVLFQIVIIQILVSFFSNSSKKKIDPLTGKAPKVFRNYLEHNDIFDIYGYVTDDGKSDLESLERNGELLFSRENQIYTHKYNKPFDITKVIYKGTSDFYKLDSRKLFMSVYLVPHKSYKEKMVPFYKSKFKEGFEGHIIVKTIPLTTMRIVKKTKVVSLLGVKKDEDVIEGENECKHWIPRLDINVIFDTEAYTLTPIDSHFSGYYKHLEEGFYDPLVYLSQFWILEEDYVCVKPHMEDTGLELSIHYSTCSPTYYAMSNQMKINSETGGLLGNQSAKEFEMLKRTMMTTNIYMLIFSGAFILLHTIFSFFALKNDIQFWHKNESMEGLSALSVIINFFCDIIIALYIFDSENTSWLILFEIGIGVLASAWKVTKAVKLGFKSEFPFVTIKNAKDYVESNTREYDLIAIKYVSIVMAPCIIGYAIYSLYYEKHKSWYSYIISVAAGSVYTFGFIMMTPQIYINYKLKSVDHLPWKALVYKSLNTFVDDVASFLIDMPWLHRLSCFRDDIIFLCYIYQRWAYRVDPSRTNAWTHSVERPIKITDRHTKDPSGESQLTNLTEKVSAADKSSEENSIRERKTQ